MFNDMERRAAFLRQLSFLIKSFSPMFRSDLMRLFTIATRLVFAHYLDIMYRIVLNVHILVSSGVSCAD